jgi:hypothetical protein
MSSITSDVIELNSINEEIKRVSAHIKTLKTKAAACEKRIQQYMEATNQPGVRFKNQAILLETKKKKVNKKKSEAESAAIEVLNRAGIANPKKLLEDLRLSGKSELKEIQTLKITEIK